MIDYYSSIKELETSNANRAFDLEDKIMYCFAGRSKNDKTSGFSGINIYDNLTSNDTIPSNVFAQRLRKSINEQKKLKLVSYNPTASVYAAQPILNGKDKDYLCQTKVEVTYLSIDNNNVSFTRPRTEFLGIVANKIVSISNHELNVDALSLTIEAAKLYSQKKYKEAFETYKRVLSIEPNNINALYRLGIMTVKGQGTKKDRKVAEKYFYDATTVYEKSNSESWYDLWNLREKAEDAYYYVSHNQVI